MKVFFAIRRTEWFTAESRAETSPYGCHVHAGHKGHSTTKKTHPIKKNHRRVLVIKPHVRTHCLSQDSRRTIWIMSRNRIGRRVVIRRRVPSSCSRRARGRRRHCPGVRCEKRRGIVKLNTNQILSSRTPGELSCSAGSLRNIFLSFCIGAPIIHCSSSTLATVGSHKHSSLLHGFWRAGFFGVFFCGKKGVSPAEEGEEEGSWSVYSEYQKTDVPICQRASSTYSARFLADARRNTRAAAYRLVARRYLRPNTATPPRHTQRHLPATSSLVCTTC